MLFWIAAAALTLAACLAVLVPLTRQRAAAVAGGHDVEVYRDQLQEVERDAARGAIETSQAEQAKVEIARRLLKADADARSTRAAGQGGMVRAAGLVGVLVIPLVSWGLYTTIGAPGLPGEPLAERMARNPSESTVDELVARAEKHLADNPDDARGWEVLGPVYMRQQRFADAATAWRNAIRLAGSNAQRESALGEAIAAAAGGVITAEAHAAFERALAHDPNEPKARFLLASGLAQEGKIAEAAEGWRMLKAALPADSGWHEPVDRAIAEAEERLGAPAAKGPDADAVAAANEMSPQDRQQMIEGMVASLDEKLRANPDDLEGWQRLIRSYVVLGRADDARAALGRALAGLEGDKKDQVSAFAAELGVKVDG
ncbi:c-type cytochrome biogenesis protein CcmI [Mesorhizobium australicum]|nr:c-type cytochrome biogenesis protein CcmI [Mesorhizobium australicum]